MSCKHLIWNCYCKHKQEFCERKLFPRLCEDYCRKDEVEDMKKIFNKGPTTNINCTCNKSTAENDYVSMLEMFINKCYSDSHYRFFGMDAIRAEECVDTNMSYLGYNQQMVERAYYDTIVHFADSKYGSCYVRFNNFTNRLIRQPHKDYENYCANNFRFVLTLILGYLNKLTDSAIIIVDDVEPYFKAKIKDVPVEDLIKAVNQTRCYVKASNDNKLAEGMRKVEAWFEEYHSKIIPPKELTIADIEKQLGYKIKIVGEEK